MSRYRDFGPLDEQSLFDGDEELIGVDERDPARGRPGFVSEAVNMVFTNRVAEPRKGIVALAWTNQVASSWPILWPFYWDNPPSMGTVHGAGVFSDPDGLEWLIIAADDTVYRARESIALEEVQLPGRVNVSGDIRFVQAF